MLQLRLHFLYLTYSRLGRYRSLLYCLCPKMLHTAIVQVNAGTPSVAVPISLRSTIILVLPYLAELLQGLRQTCGNRAKSMN
jgi:hypothetical protein